MNFKMKVINFLLLIFCAAQPLSAQKGIVSSGGDFDSPNGSVAYSVGQISYVSIYNETGNVNPGLQQPFELGIVGTRDLYQDSMLLLYPNPANQDVYLQFSSDESLIRPADFLARIYDMKGKLLITQRLRDDINTISIRELPSGIYLIQIWQANTFIQSNSFSKTN